MAIRGTAKQTQKERELKEVQGKVRGAARQEKARVEQIEALQKQLAQTTTLRSEQTSHKTIMQENETLQKEIETLRSLLKSRR